MARHQQQQVAVVVPPFLLPEVLVARVVHLPHALLVLPQALAHVVAGPREQARRRPVLGTVLILVRLVALEGVVRQLAGVAGVLPLLLLPPPPLAAVVQAPMQLLLALWVLVSLVGVTRRAAWQGVARGRARGLLLQVPPVVVAEAPPLPGLLAAPQVLLPAPLLLLLLLAATVSQPNLPAPLRHQARWLSCFSCQPVLPASCA